jgi:hypothetical protein
LAVVSTATYQISKRIPVVSPFSPNILATKDGQQVWLTHKDVGKVSVLDVRRCPPNCARQAHWLLHEFCPLAEQAFRKVSPIFGAHLVFPAHLAHYTEVVLPILAYPATSRYQVAAFIDEGPTIEWLHSQQPT